jgi:hypothetical protein
MSELKKIILFISVFFYSIAAFAQSNCSNKLKQARDLFESGQIEQIPGLLDSCFNKGFGKDEENQAYRLLIQTYLFDYNRDKAMEVMHKFLNKYPDYQFSSSDPVEIKEIFDSFDVNPNWGFGVTLGTNLSQVNLIQNYSVFNQNKYQTEYTPKLGYHAGLLIEKFFGTQVGLSLGLEYRVVNYQNTETSGDNISSVQFTEKNTSFAMPITGSYCIGKGKISPFVFGGANIGLLLNSEGNYTLHVLSGDGTQITSKGTQIISETRSLIDYSAYGGVGLRYKIHKGYLKLWAGYNYSFQDYVLPDKRYQNTDNILKYNYIDDDIQLNHFSFTITYTQLLYKIKVKKSNVEN